MSIRTVLGFKPHSDAWRPGVIQAVASEGKGIDAIAALIGKHRAYQEAGDILRRKRMDRIRERIREMVGERLQVRFWNDKREAALERNVGPVYELRTTPYEVADELVRTFPG